MNRFFKNAPAKPTDQDRVDRLRGSLEAFRVRHDDLMRKAGDEENKAKMFMNANNKKMALMAMKRRRVYENDMVSTSNTIMSLETQLSSIESARLNANAVEAMRDGAIVMSGAFKGLTLDDVDEVSVSVQMQIQDNAAISDAIARPIGNNSLYTDEDEIQTTEDEMMNELHLLMDTGATTNNTTDTSVVKNIPPRTTVDDIVRLEAELGM